MANTIKLAHNATSGKTPTDLAAGEVAINSTNKKIWVGTNGTTAGQVLVFDHSIYSTDLSDNDTTYSAGNGLSLSGTVFSHSNTSSQSSSNNSGRTYIQDVTLDTYGHVTGLATATETVTNTDTNTTYSAGSGLSLSSTTFSHADTSSQGSVNNSGRTYIQDVSLDTYGHVTSLSSATETVTNTDTNTTYSAGTGLNLSGTTFGLNESLGRSYIEMGNATGSVSNDGSWNARFNVAGSSHARIDVYENDDGIKATMYAHTGHTGPRFGSMSNHPVNFMCNGTNRATLTTAGSLSTTVQGTLWGTSSKFTAGSNLSWSGSTLNATDTNTTYSAGSGLSLSGTSFSHSDTSSQSSVNNSGRTYIQDVTLDGYGHVTSLSSATETVTNTDTNTTYSAGSGLSLSSTTFSHADTSSQGSVNNSGRTYIQDVSLDTYGHVTSLSSATETVTNTDTNTTYTAGSMLSLSGTTFSLAASSRPVFSACNQNNWDTIATASSSQGGIEIYNNGAGNDAFMSFHCGGDYAIYFGLDADNNKLSVGGWSMGANKYQIYHSGNPSPNTTYSAGSGLGLSGTTFSHSDTSSQSSVNNSGRTYIQDITLDTYGHVTSLASATETVTNTDTNTTYSAGSGLSLSSTTFSHADTSSQSSVNNSGRTYIQDVSLDTYGHVTSLTSATETVTNTDTNTTYSAGNGLSLSSTTFSHADTSSQASVNNSGRTYIQDVTLDTYGHVTGLASATESAATLSEVDDAIEAYGGSMNNLSGASNLFGGASSGVTNQGLSRDVAYKIMTNTNSSVACVTTTGGSSEYYLRYKNGGNFSWERIAWNHIEGMSTLDPLP